jgi:hypothetical protein
VAAVNAAFGAKHGSSVFPIDDVQKFGHIVHDGYDNTREARRDHRMNCKLASK